MTLVADSELARLAGAAYRGPWSSQVALDCEYDFLPRGDEEIVFVIPGTHPTDPLDWIRDLRVAPRHFATIGTCHAGFGAGATAIAKSALPLLSGETRLVTVTGHSLGGAMALIVGALLIASGFRVRIVTFGAPRVAFFVNLALPLLVRRGLALREYRRSGDPVPGVPFFPLFKHATRGIALGADCSSPIGNHAIERYAADLTAKEAATG